jgi:hypothetical protein
LARTIKANLEAKTDLLSLKELLYLSYITDIIQASSNPFVQIMFDDVLKRVRFEVELLGLVVAVSIACSAWLMIDASISIAIERSNWAIMTFRLLELAFGASWIFFSAKMSREMLTIRRKHFRVIFPLKEEQKKSVATESVRDMLAFYRGYYRWVATIMVLAVAVGLSTILATALLLFLGNMPMWEAVSRWGINSSMLLIASALYMHVHRSWGRKLLKVEDAEKKLSEALGGPIEA